MKRSNGDVCDLNKKKSKTQKVVNDGLPPSPPPLFVKFPRDILLMIGDILSLFEIANLSATCCRLRNVFKEKRKIWVNLDIGSRATLAGREGRKHIIESFISIELPFKMKSGHVYHIHYDSIHQRYIKPYLINAALHGAAFGGHLKLMKWLSEEYKADQFNLALYEAAKGGQQKVMEWLICRHGTLIFPIAFNKAAGCGQLNIMEWLLERYGNSRYDFKDAFREAAGGGHIIAMKWLIEERGIHCFEFTSAFNEAAEGGHINVMRWLIEEFGVHWALCGAASYDDLNTMRWIIREYESNDLNQALNYAIEYGYIKSIRFLKREILLKKIEKWLR